MLGFLSPSMRQVPPQSKIPRNHVPRGFPPPKAGLATEVGKKPLPGSGWEARVGPAWRKMSGASAPLAEALDVLG